MAKRRGRRGGYRISHGGQYKMTPKRRAALRKAQMASARKRRGLSTRTKIGIGVGVTGTVAAGAVLGTGIVRHKISGSQLDITIGRGRRGEMVPAKPIGGHGPKVTHIHRGPGRRDILSAHHRTRQVQDPADPHSAKAGGVQITSSGRETPWREEHVFGVSIPFLGHLGGRYQHRGVSGRELKQTLSSPSDVSKILFGKKVSSGGAPPQATGLSPARPHTPGRRITQAQRDAIPHNRPGNKSQKGPVWPGQVSSESAKEQNEGLRNGTHYLHPVKGVVEYPATAKGRKAVNNRILRWQMGVDRGVLPRGWYD
jgi:hypothetical protein